jgi:hypothetical protein
MIEGWYLVADLIFVISIRLIYPHSGLLDENGAREENKNGACMLARLRARSWRLSPKPVVETRPCCLLLSCSRTYYTRLEHYKNTQGLEANATHSSKAAKTLASCSDDVSLLLPRRVGPSRGRRDSQRRHRAGVAARGAPRGGGPAGRGGREGGVHLGGQQGLAGAADGGVAERRRGHAGRRPELVGRRRARQGGGEQQGGREAGRELPHQGGVPQEEGALRQGLHALGAQQVRRQVHQVLCPYLLGPADEEASFCDAIA